MAEDFGLPLLEAARRAGVTIADPREPQDRYITLNGLRLHYLDWGGEGLPWMVCLHGRAQNAHMWDFAALALCTRYRILALDQRGHGDSQWAHDGDYSLEAQQKDLEAFVDALNIDDMVLMGLSMGGRNAFVYASRHPERVRALVVAEAAPEIKPQGASRILRFLTEADVLDSFDAFVQRNLRDNPRREEWMARGSLRHNLKRLPDGRWTWKYDPVFRRGPLRPPKDQAPLLWQAWQKVACPVLLIRGAESDVISPEVAQRMQGMLLGRARLVQVPHAGHLVTGDNPPAFEAALRAFLGEVEGTGA